MLALKPHDRFNLLNIEIKSMETIEDILQDDGIGLLEDQSEDIFDLKHVKPFSERQKADYVAKKKM